MSSAESEAAGHVGGEISALTPAEDVEMEPAPPRSEAVDQSKARPVTPPKSRPSVPPQSTATAAGKAAPSPAALPGELAGPALAKAAGPAESAQPKAVAARPGTVMEEVAEEEEDGDGKGAALDKLTEMVRHLQAMDACLRHFSAVEPEPKPEEPAAGQDGDAEVPDWGADDDKAEADNAAVQAGSWEKGPDVSGMQGSSAEEIARLSELLLQQKQLLEGVLADKDAKEKEDSAAGEVFTLLLQGRWAEFKQAFEQLRPNYVETLLDNSGFNVLHHVVRSWDCDLIQSVLERAPGLANMTTHAHRQPGHWTPLMIFANMPQPPPGADQHDESRVAFLLCQNMTLSALNTRGSTSSTATHLACSRAKIAVVKCILYRIDDLGGRAAVMAHTQLANSTAQG